VHHAGFSRFIPYREGFLKQRFSRLSVFLSHRVFHISSESANMGADDEILFRMTHCLSLRLQG